MLGTKTMNLNIPSAMINNEITDYYHDDEHNPHQDL